MNSSLTDRIEQNRFSGEARSLRHQQADEAIRNHYAANCKRAAHTLAGLLDEQRSMTEGGDHTLEETARAVVEEFEHALKGLNQMPKSWMAGDVTHYDKANAKATREYLSDYFLALAEHMAFLGNPPAAPAHTLWDFRKQVIERNPDFLEEAFLIANRILGGNEDGSANDALSMLFLKVLDDATGNPWWQDRLHNVRRHLDRAVRFRTMRRNTTWATDA